MAADHPGSPARAGRPGQRGADDGSPGRVAVPDAAQHAAIFTLYQLFHPGLDPVQPAGRLSPAGGILPVAAASLEVA